MIFLRRFRRLFSLLFPLVFPLRHRSPFWYVVLAIAIALSCVILPVRLSPGLAVSANSVPIVPESDRSSDRSNAAIQRLYETRQFDAAAEQLQQLIQTHRASGDSFGEAVALRNLALVELELGNWTEAQTAIEHSLNLLQTQAYPDGQTAIAQALEVQGKLQFVTGRATAALETWDRAIDLHRQRGDTEAIARTTLNQIEALQSLGMYRRAIATLEAVISSLPPQSPILGRALRELGDALWATGDRRSAEETLAQALAIAALSGNGEETALTHLSLGRVLSFANPPDTLSIQSHYQQARQSSVPLVQLQAQLGLFQRLKEDGSWEQAKDLISDLQLRLDRLPASHAAIYARIHFVQTWLELEEAIAGDLPLPAAPLRTAATQLAIARQQAELLQDGRAESYAMGNLGKLYQQTQQWETAQSLTEQALHRAQQLRADDMGYLWQWQLGQILNAQGKQTAAIAAYHEAIQSLQELQKDLVIAPEVQLSFRNSIEPIHRQFVQVLLNHDLNQEPAADRLEEARITIESLQLAELNDFFRDACLTLQPTQLEQLDRQAAIIYPIILPDRLEVILSLPQTPIHHTSINLSQNRVIGEVRQFRQRLSSPAAEPPDRLLSHAQTLYEWLVRPFETDLAEAQVKTIVFVLDQQFRNIPMSALHNGQQYLIENYRIAVAPGLKLLTPPSQPSTDLRVLLAGLSEPYPGFSALHFVPEELAQIRRTIPGRSRVLMNQEFTAATLRQALQTANYPIVHLATHGKFSPNFTDSFLLTGDGGRLDINQLQELLQSTTLNHPLQLLVLSACETATSGSDPRATLGLAGIAVRSGAESTVATLWQVSDESTALLMTRFYQGLADRLPKAEALRQAQLALLREGSYQHPFFWSAVILIGNWT
ncbi:CHAT domain-containing protein [Leptolyngbya ohadii]|uniref:CHAT domain-containing protein n=1 Tax=Leptolyngbya ohadii TaxID=1962290 RepID=UPI000B59D67F|nr:CHAT domain-containing protein [Leptolyngbya ohadii]